MDIKSLLKKDIAGLPFWIWGIAALGGVGIGLYFYRRSKASSISTDTPATPTDATTTTGQAGYGDYQPAGSSAGNQTPTGATINIGVPATPSNWLTSLILTSSHPINLYATAGQPGGLPDAIVGTIPPGATIQATGPEIVGAWNVPNGSELWYPVVYQGTPGFISATDVSNASTTIGNQQYPPPPTTTTVTSVTKGVLASTPAGTRVGGKNLKDIPVGATMTLVSPTPVTNKYGSYYQVLYQGQTGWVNKTTIGK